jgi:hypothetical protein
VFSAYELLDGTRIWIITEGDRSVLEDGPEFLFHRTTEDNEITSLKIDFK